MWAEQFLTDRENEEIHSLPVTWLSPINRGFLVQWEPLTSHILILSLSHQAPIIPEWGEVIKVKHPTQGHNAGGQTWHLPVQGPALNDQTMSSHKITCKPVSKHTTKVNWWTGKGINKWTDAAARLPHQICGPVGQMFHSLTQEFLNKSFQYEQIWVLDYICIVSGIGMLLCWLVKQNWRKYCPHT